MARLFITDIVAHDNRVVFTKKNQIITPSAYVQLLYTHVVCFQKS